MARINTHAPDLEGSDTAVCLGNLATLNERQGHLYEVYLAVLSELANAILQDAGGDPNTVDSLLRSLQERTGDGDIILPDTILVNQAAVEMLTTAGGIPARLCLYRLLEERLKRPPATVSPLAPLTEGARGRIAYMAGAFADEAYARLSACVPHARAAICHSFPDACEEVHAGLCEYAILPFENTQSGKLTAFSDLVIRYRLCLLAVCDLENRTEPGQVTRYALVCRRGDEDIPTPPAPTAAPFYWELVHTTDTPPLHELLSAAAHCGLTLHRIDTLPPAGGSDADEADTLPVSCVFDATDGDMATFQRYLTLEAPDTRFLGYYGTV